MSVTDLPYEAILRALILLAVGWILGRLARRAVNLIPQDVLRGQNRRLVTQAAFIGVFVLFLASALRQLGFDLTVLLGAAGVLTVAIGFASQTSVSNLISGFFLFAEKSFDVGDFIKVGDTVGQVLSIDPLSVKLRTFDNLFVRIPNENLIKTTTTTLSRFPIRRYDLQVGIAYKEDIAKAREVLLGVARDFPLCLNEPKPLIILQGFGDSSVNIQFSVWAARENFLDLRNGILERVKIAFDKEGIEIPFPHRTLYTGSATTPMPITIVPPGVADESLTASD